MRERLGQNLKRELKPPRQAEWYSFATFLNLPGPFQVHPLGSPYSAIQRTGLGNPWSMGQSHRPSVFVQPPAENCFYIFNG